MGGKCRSIREAERRLDGILNTARKLSVSPEDLVNLNAVKKLTQPRCTTNKHMLPLLAGLLTILVVMLVCSADRHCGYYVSQQENVRAAAASEPASNNNHHNHQDTSSEQPWLNRRDR